MDNDDRTHLIGEPEPRTRAVTKIVLAVVSILIVIAILVYAIAASVLLAKCKGHLTNDDTRTAVDCDVLIIGTGFAGAYAAYELAPIYRSSLCIVEKLSRDGGRVLDVAQYEGGPVFGVGALRVTSTQKTMLNLAVELCIPLQLAEEDTELLKVRGQYFYRAISQTISESKLMCEKAFKLDKCDYNGTDTDKALLSFLLDAYKKDPTLADKHPDFPTYIIQLLGDEGLAFIRESVRYNSPFTSISTRGVLDFFVNELAGMGLDPDRYYPKGGMSLFITKMLAEATKKGARIFRSEPVVEIHSDLKMADSPIFVKTTKFDFKADKVLCSIDPISMKDVTGNVAETVKEAREFQVIKPKALSIVTAWWPDRWWERSKLTESANLSRVVSHQNCFNTMDIPTFAYGRDQNVTRAVYDDGACVDMWRWLVGGVSNERLVAYNVSELEQLATEVVNSLQHVFTDVVVPRPRFLHGFVHENAWHFQDPRSMVSNLQIQQWSQRPIKNKNFALIGEAYNLNFAAWCDGALKSVMTVLSNFYNFRFPCLYDTGSPAICPIQKERKSQIQTIGSFNDILP